MCVAAIASVEYLYTVITAFMFCHYVLSGRMLYFIRGMTVLLKLPMTHQSLDWRRVDQCRAGPVISIPALPISCHLTPEKEKPSCYVMLYCSTEVHPVEKKLRRKKK